MWSLRLQSRWVCLATVFAADRRNSIHLWTMHFACRSERSAFPIRTSAQRFLWNSRFPWMTSYTIVCSRIRPPMLWQSEENSAWVPCHLCKCYDWKHADVCAWSANVRILVQRCREWRHIVETHTIWIWFAVNIHRIRAVDMEISTTHNMVSGQSHSYHRYIWKRRSILEIEIRVWCIINHRMWMHLPSLHCSDEVFDEAIGQHRWTETHLVEWLPLEISTKFQQPLLCRHGRYI